MTKKAFWLSAVVGVLWIGIGLRDLFAPGLFSISPSVASRSTIVLDFIAAAGFLACAFSFRQVRPTVK